MPRSALLLACALAGSTLASLAASPTEAAPLNGFAALGTSETAGTTYTCSWVPYLVVDPSRGTSSSSTGRPSCATWSPAPTSLAACRSTCLTASTDPAHFFQDGIHPGAVGNGSIANLLLAGLDAGYDANQALLTDQEVLARAGLSASYTGETSGLDFDDYVYFTPVPEPSTAVLFAAGLGCLGIRRRRRAG